jgi:DNA-binding CsgD family transcriptional regulator
MDIESKIWNYSNTGVKLHAFLNGTALCRSSIRRPAADATALDYCEAKSHQMCAACDTKFNAAVERSENSVQRSTAEDITTEKGTPMGAAHRRYDGPLTATQNAAVDGMVAGKQQQEVAEELGVAPSYVSSELGIARRKLGCSTVAHMVGIVARRNAYIEAANLIEEQVMSEDIAGGLEEGEVHVNHVLMRLASILRGRAALLVPA